MQKLREKSAKKLINVAIIQFKLPTFSFFLLFPSKRKYWINKEIKTNLGQWFTHDLGDVVYSDITVII